MCDPVIFVCLELANMDYTDYAAYRYLCTSNKYCTLIMCVVAVLFGIVATN